MIGKPRTLLLLALVLAALALALVPAAAPSAPRSLDVVHAGVHQYGPELVLKVRTAEDWRPRDLGPESLCLELHRAGRSGRVCATGARRLRLRYDRLGPDGSVVRSRRLTRADVHRHDRHSFAASFGLAGVGLRPGTAGWRVFSSPRAGCPTPGEPSSCRVSVPRAGLERLRIRRPRRVGCTRHGPTLLRNGSRRSKAMAITFDDGPSRYTPAVLRVLHRFHAPATFFLVGARVRRHARLARRESQAGDDLGNHSLHHSLLPSYRDLRATNRIIRRASGFEPCAFRPPYDGVNGRLLRSARSLGMTSVLWDIDPRDWSLPGAAAIERRALTAAHPGAILLMHDGGGPRSQTVAALPVILRGLERRGYRLETVSRLLGGRDRWYPR